MTIFSWNLPTSGLVLLTLGAIAIDNAGLLATSPTLIAILSVLLLVFGLPHGSFDLALLSRPGAFLSRTRSRFVVVTLYIGCAAAMYLAWRLAPVLALASFLVLATAHFSEDWDDCGSGFLAAGIAAALVTMPALLHREALGGLFTLLTGDSRAAELADVMVLLAPTAGAVAIVGIAVMWQLGRRTTAVSAACALAATMLLPPVPGFALFFCFVHSPTQFRHHADSLGLRGVGEWGRIVMPLSLGGLGMAAAVFLLNDRASFTAGMFAGSFMTLSILTVPHMLVPLLASQQRPGQQPAIA